MKVEINRPYKAGKKEHSSLDMMWATENRAYITNLDDISAATSGCLG